MLLRFEDFVSCFQENKNENSEWVDPVRNTQNNNPQVPVQRKATQVFVILKEKAKQKYENINIIFSKIRFNLF